MQTMPRHRFARSGTFVIAGCLVLLNNSALASRRSIIARVIIADDARRRKPLGPTAPARDKHRTINDTHRRAFDLLSAGYCSIIRCAFYILHTSYASAAPEISAAQGKQISFQIKTSNTYAGGHAETYSP